MSDQLIIWGIPSLQSATMQVLVFYRLIISCLFTYSIKKFVQCVVNWICYGTKCFLFVTLCTFHSYPWPFLGLVRNEKAGVTVRPLTGNRLTA